MDESITGLLATAFTGGASDVFLIEGERPRVRSDGELLIAHGGPLDHETLAELWRSCGIDPATATDGDASLGVPDIGRLRVNAYRTLGRLAVALRPIKQDIPGFAELGLPQDLLADWLQRRAGLILITGPTGAGKSTSIAACLDWINHHEARHIVTIEDPIEFLFRNDRACFSQREVRSDTATFPVALRAALRQSPDVIFLGEIRDAETAETALRAAETGHLVVSTLHSSGAVESIERLTSILQASPHGTASLLSQTLVGILSQQLLPRINGGLQIVLEYFQNEGATRRWIAEGRLTELQDHLHRAESAHAVSFLNYLVAAARQSVIDPAIARSACDRPQDFDRAMRGIF